MNESYFPELGKQNLDDEVKTALNDLLNADDTRKLLTLYGDVSSGKTHQLQLICRRWAGFDRLLAFDGQQLVQRIGYNKIEKFRFDPLSFIPGSNADHVYETQLWEIIASAGCVVLDNIDLVELSYDAAAILKRILDSRKHKLTVLAHQGMVEETMHRSIVAAMSQGQAIHMQGQYRRAD